MAVTLDIRAQWFRTLFYNGTLVIVISGYEGTLCEQEVDECEKFEPCRNNASCTDLLRDYHCSCTHGYGGKNCSITLIACQDNHNCMNDGMCLPHLEDEKKSEIVVMFGVEAFVVQLTQGSCLDDCLLENREVILWSFKLFFFLVFDELSKLSSFHCFYA